MDFETQIRRALQQGYRLVTSAHIQLAVEKAEMAIANRENEEMHDSAYVVRCYACGSMTEAECAVVCGAKMRF